MHVHTHGQQHSQARGGRSRSGSWIQVGLWDTGGWRARAWELPRGKGVYGAEGGVCMRMVGG